MVREAIWGLPVTLNNEERPSGHRARLAVCLGIVWLLFWVNARWPVLRFTSYSLNDTVFAVAQLIPWFLVYCILQWRTARWRKWTVGALMLFLSLLASSFVLMTAPFVNPFLGAIDRREELLTPRGTVVVYYLHGVLYHGYRVRQQCTVLPGVLAVHEFYQTPNPGHSANVELLDSRRVRITASYGFRPEERSIVRNVDLWPLPCLWSRAG